MGFHGGGGGAREKTRKNCNSRQPDLTVVDHVCVCVCACVKLLVVSDSLQPYGL